MTTGRINQVTASVFAGPEGPHRRASAITGTTPCILAGTARSPAKESGFVACRLGPRRGFHLVTYRAPPPARADGTDVWDNLVIDCRPLAVVSLDSR